MLGPIRPQQPGDRGPASRRNFDDADAESSALTPDRSFIDAYQVVFEAKGPAYRKLAALMRRGSVKPPSQVTKTLGVRFSAGGTPCTR
jgi:hypothetical protein